MNQPPETVHDAIQRQVRALLEDADISEEDRQKVLIGMSCPCCGGSGLSFSLELGKKPDPTAG